MASATGWKRIRGAHVAVSTLALAAAAGCLSAPAARSCPDDGCAVDAARVDAPTLDAAAIDAPLACTGTTRCFPGGSSVEAVAACVAPPGLGVCVPEGWDFCGCGDSATPAVFVFPETGTITDVVVALPAGVENVTLRLNDGCAGLNAGCELVGVGCDAGGSRAYHWSGFDNDAFAAGPGDHAITLFEDDLGVVCDTDDGGAVVLSLPFTQPP